MTTTAACLAIGLIAAAVLAATAVLCRGARLKHVLDDLDLPRGGAGCGCFWHYLPGGHVRLYTCEKHAFICSPDGEA